MATLFALGVAVFVLRTDAGMEHDDAVYLTRGFYHAAQAAERGDLVLPRLVWSLGFESPKPPLYHGLLALAALVSGRAHVGFVLVAGTLVPLLTLTAAIFALSREAGGTNAGLFGVAIYLAMPVALGLGTRLLTETTLAATVVAGVFFAYRRARGGGLRDEMGVGICAGLSLLAKLSAPLFLAPAVMVALFSCWRAEGARRALRFAAVTALLSSLIAGPWYVRNGTAALAFARYASQHPPSLYTSPAWMRPPDFIAGTIGWAAAVVLLLLLWRRPASHDAARLLEWMTLAAAVPSALVTGVLPMFDPRYWLPAVPLLAAWAGVHLAGLRESAPRPWRPFVAMATAAFVIAAITVVAITPRPRMAWNTSHAVAVLPLSIAPPGTPLLCTLGNNKDWNVAKLRLAVELSGIRPRFDVADVLVDGRAIGLTDRLARCGVVFALRPDEVAATPNERALNADLAAGWAELDRRAAELVRAPQVAAALGSRAHVEVFLRRSSVATLTTPHRPAAS